MKNIEKNQKKKNEKKELAFLENAFWENDPEYKEDLELMNYIEVHTVIRDLSTKVTIEGPNGIYYNDKTDQGELELINFFKPESTIRIKRGINIIKIKVYKELDFIIDDSEGFIHIYAEVN